MPKLIAQLLEAIQSNQGGTIALRRIFDDATQEEINECYSTVTDEYAEQAKIVRDALVSAGVDIPPYVELNVEVAPPPYENNQEPEIVTGN